MIDAVIGQDQDNRRKGTRPNQGLEPPLLWSVEFMKEVVHVESNETGPLVFRCKSFLRRSHQRQAARGVAVVNALAKAGI